MRVTTDLMINNASNYAKDKRYIVATLVKGELWYYGSTNSPEQALDMQEDGFKTGDTNRIVIERAKYE